MLSSKIASKFNQMISHNKSRMNAGKRAERKKNLEFFAGELEKRQLLAAFSFDSGTGVLAIESDADNETLSIVSTSVYGNYTITSTSIFTGDESPGNVIGNATNSLQVLGNSVLTNITITNNAANSGVSFYFGDSAGNSFLNNLTVNLTNPSSGQISVANQTAFSNDASVQLATTGNNLVVSANLSADGAGRIWLTGDTVTVGANLSAPAGVTINAGDLNITGNILASSGSVDIVSTTSLDLGTETSGKLSLTNAEANRIFGLGLNISSPDLTDALVTTDFYPQNVGDLSIDSPDISVQGNLTALNTILLRTATLDISNTTTTVTPGAGGVSIWAQAPIDLGTESVGYLSLTNGELNLITADALSIFTFIYGLDVTDSITYSGDITIATDSDITETGAGRLVLSGNAIVNSQSGQIILGNSTNDFASFGGTALGNITLKDQNSISLARIAAGDANSSTISNLSVTAGANITQTGDIVITGTSNFTAGGNITLDNPDNDFAIFTANGTQIVVVDRSADGLTLGSIVATGLNATSTSGNISQIAPANVSSGTANFTANGLITLANSSNDFGTIKANGTIVTIRDTNALTLGNITASNLSVQAGAISQSGAAVVTGTSSFVSTSTISLNQSNNSLGDVTSNGVLTISNGLLNSLNPVGGNVTISGGNISSATTTSVNLNLAGGILNGLTVTNGVSNLSGGTFNGQANVTGGQLISSINYNSLTVGTSGQANVTSGVIAGVTSEGSLNLLGGSLGTLLTSGTSTLSGGNVTGLTTVTGGQLNSSVSLGNVTINAGTANLSSGSANVVEVQSGNLISSAGLTELTVLGGVANLSSGTVQTVTQQGGTLRSCATITGGADLSSGDTYIFSSGQVNGSTSITGGNLTSNGVLSAVVVNSPSSSANLTGGSAANLTNNGGTIISSASVSGNNTINSGTTTINSDGIVSGSTLVTPSGSASSVLYSSGNLSTVSIGSNGTAHLTGGRASGQVTLSSGGRLNTSATANTTGLIQINGGTANLAGVQSGTVNVNGATANVTFNTAVTGLTTVTLSNTTSIRSSTGPLTINGVNANVSFGSGNYTIGATSLSANRSQTIPANTTLTSLTQSNGTVTMIGTVTGLTSVTGGTLLSNGTLATLDIAINGNANITGGTIGDTTNAGLLDASAGDFNSITSSGTTNLTGGSVNLLGLSNVTGGTFTANAILANLTVAAGATANLTGGSANVATVSGTLINAANLTSLGVLSGGTATLSAGVVSTGSSAGTLNLTGGILSTFTVTNGVSTLSGGQVGGLVNVTGGSLVSSLDLSGLAVGASGSASISAGTIGATTNAGTLTATGGTFASITSGGTTNLNGGGATVQGLSNITGGSFTANASLSNVMVGDGTANLVAGSVSGVANVSGGTLISSVNLNNLTVGASGTANISAGTVGATTNAGVLNASGGSFGTTTTTGTLNSSGGVFSSIDSSGTTGLTGGSVSGVTNITAGTFSTGTFATLSGTVNVSGGSATFGGTQSGALNVSNGSATVTSTIGSTLNVSGSGSANVTTTGTVTGLTSVSGGTLTTNGTLSGGLSTTGGSVNTDNIGTVAGSNLTLGSNSTLNASGASLASYGRIAASSVTINNATLSLSPSFTLANESAFTIIDNTGGSAVSGTFNGLPEGSRITAGANNLTISYRGGVGGNNVVLYRTGGLSTVVNSTADVTDPNDNVVTLREAINYARLNAATTGANQDVTFALGSYPATITLQAGADYGVLAVNQNSTLAIAGPAVGSGNRVTVSGGGATGIFNLATATNLSNLTLSGASATHGAAIYNNATTSINALTIQDNAATDGAGLYNAVNGNLTITNSTFANNTASTHGGAIDNNGGSITLSQTTIAFNSAANGGGIDNITGSVSLTNTVVANNTGTSTGPDILGSVNASYSLIGNTSGASITGSNNQQNVSALLGSFNYYGGTTKVFPLLPGSPAINSGTGSGVTDQRGITVAGTADMGSFQSRGFTITNTGGNCQTAMIGDAFPTNLSLSVASAYSEPVNGGVVTFTAPAGNVPSATLAGSTTISGGNVSVQATANAFYGATANQNYNITANASGEAAGTSYQLLNVGTPFAVNITGGNNQSGNITGNFGQTLGINVKDSVGNNIPRLSVTFTPTTITNTPNGTFGALGNVNGAGAGNVYTGQTDANGNITGLTYASNGIGGLVRIVSNATVASNLIRPAGTATANFTEGAVGLVVQNGTAGRSFVNAVSGLFGNAGLAANLPASQYKIQYLGYSGTDTPSNVTLANGSASSANINWSYGANGITGDPNSQNRDGVYQLAVDYNNDGVFETAVKFHRLFGDVNGDKVVDTLDYNTVISATVYGKYNITSGANTNGVGQVYTKDVTTVLRQRGRRVIYSTY